MKFCEKCGKEIMDEAVVCPGCGCATTTEATTVQVTVPKRARTASVFGILSLLLLAPLGIPAIVLAIKSKEETGGVMCKQAKTGLVFGIIGLCLWGISLLTLVGGI